MLKSGGSNGCARRAVVVGWLLITNVLIAGPVRVLREGTPNFAPLFPTSNITGASTGRQVGPPGTVAVRCPRCGRVRFVRKSPTPSMGPAEAVSPSNFSNGAHNAGFSFPTAPPPGRALASSPMLDPNAAQSFSMGHELVPNSGATPPSSSNQPPVAVTNYKDKSPEFGEEITFIGSGAASPCMGGFIHKGPPNNQDQCDLVVLTAGHCVRNAENNWHKVEIKGLATFSKNDIKLALPDQFVPPQLQTETVNGRQEAYVGGSENDAALIRLTAKCSAVPDSRVLPLAATDEKGFVKLDPTELVRQQKRVTPVVIGQQVINSGGGGLIQGELASGRVLVFKRGKNTGELHSREEAQAMQRQDPSLVLQEYALDPTKLRYLVTTGEKPSQHADSGAPILNSKGELLGPLSGGNGEGNDFVFYKGAIGFAKKKLREWYGRLG